MAGCPITAPLCRRHGSFGDNIWDAEPTSDRRPQPIGSLMINMIREPKLWREFTKLSVAAKEVIGDPLSQHSQSGLSGGFAIPLIAAKPRHQNELVSGEA
jgi:hypothetical protein